MAMKLKVVRPYRSGDMIYDVGAIIEPAAAAGEYLRARGICVPAKPSDLKPRAKTGEEVAKAPEPEVPEKRHGKKHKTFQPPEVTNVNDDA